MPALGMGSSFSSMGKKDVMGIQIVYNKFRTGAKSELFSFFLNLTVGSIFDSTNLATVVTVASTKSGRSIRAELTKCQSVFFNHFSFPPRLQFRTHLSGHRL